MNKTGCSCPVARVARFGTCGFIAGEAAVWLTLEEPSPQTTARENEDSSSPPIYRGNMRNRTLRFVTWASGYVLGDRAGRQRFEEIRDCADRIWEHPSIQRTPLDAQDVGAQPAPRT